ncbi:DsbC/DsbD-like thiol-disulfide interchange protein [Phyllobacterium bourgognense]|uniref:DsbC/DsbD-like thiol-disulfide interchange protein n=2 Tax=Phyllobacterium bourgognense TaxID=314236 RepID=A0A368YGC8_9HYPH|nr:DsbC/DsbD-like thiol-disulfide interchange protein [Phyllobacterium bourgognense]
MIRKISDILDSAQKACKAPKMKIELLFFAAVIAFTAPAYANSEWTKTPGGNVRLVIDNPVQPSPEIRGAIEINLDPGWKTYWREPGDAGVPPELDLTESTNIKSYALSFPTPHRFDDGNTHWAGYKKPVSLPLTLTLTDPAKPAHLKGHAFLGICETICIPVKAEFDFSVDSTKRTDALTKTLVDAAFEQLPGEASATFGARSAIRKDDHVRVTVDLPADDANTDIFVAGDGAVTFGMSKLKDRQANSAVFSVRIISGKDKKTPPLNYTLVQGAKAVSGTVDVQE